MAFELPGGAFVEAPGASEDLRRKILRPPRPGVFLEDPLRVLRAARFLAQLPGFRVAPERRSGDEESGKIPSNGFGGEAARRAGQAARGAAEGPRRARCASSKGSASCESLIRSSAPRTRRGISLVSRLESRDPRVARALLLFPQGPKRAEDLLRRWKTSREEQRLASRLFSLPLGGHAAGIGTRRDVAELLRRSSPFAEESLLFLLAAGDARRRDLARRGRGRASPPCHAPPDPQAHPPSSTRRNPNAPFPRRGPAARRGARGPSISRSPSGEIRGPRAARAWLAAGVPGLENALPGWYPKASPSRTSTRWI